MNAQLKLAIEARDRGISRVKAKNADFIRMMRRVARMIALRNGTVCADDLRAWLGSHPDVERPSHYNAYGAIFSRNPDFEFHSYYTSTQKQGHGNRLIRWRLTR